MIASICERAHCTRAYLFAAIRRSSKFLLTRRISEIFNERCRTGRLMPVTSSASRKLLRLSTGAARMAALMTSATYNSSLLFLLKSWNYFKRCLSFLANLPDATHRSTGHIKFLRCLLESSIWKYTIRRFWEKWMVTGQSNFAGELSRCAWTSHDIWEIRRHPKRVDSKLG